MARRDEVTGRRPKSAGRKKPRRGPPPIPTHCFSIPSFAAAFGFSEAFFYKLVSQGQGPRLMKIGRRTFITFQAADEWQCQREAATAAE
jgi:predicted DNA-binding transcriptional regulator AlpA